MYCLTQAGLDKNHDQPAGAQSGHILPWKTSHCRHHFWPRKTDHESVEISVRRPLTKARQGMLEKAVKSQNGWESLENHVNASENSTWIWLEVFLPYPTWPSRSSLQLSCPHHHTLPTGPEGSGSLYSFKSAKATKNNLFLCFPLTPHKSVPDSIAADVSWWDKS